MTTDDRARHHPARVPVRLGVGSMAVVMRKDTLDVTCNACGFTGTLRAVEVHSCYVQEMGGRCEDYPCCGHTDGDGCQTRPEHTSAYWLEGPGAKHLMCDHEAGFCDAEPDFDYCRECGEEDCVCDRPKVEVDDEA